MPRFILRYALRRPAWAKATHAELYRTCIEQCEWADRVGFHSVMISEHHGSEDGYMASPLVIGGAIAARTQQLRIKIAALVAPLHNPVRLAEDIAALDILSNGRVDPLVSAGYVESEFRMMGKRLSDRKRFMDELVPFLKQAWSGEPFEWQGQTIQVRPTPVQKPHPPIHMGAASPAAARRAGKYADHFLPSRVDLNDIYREERIKQGRGDPGKAPHSVLLWLAEDPDAFWEKLGPHALHENNCYAQWYEETGAWNGYERARDVDELREMKRYRVVTPEWMISRARALGPEDDITLHPLVGAFDPEEAWRSLRLVEAQVLPALRV